MTTEKRKSCGNKYEETFLPIIFLKKEKGAAGFMGIREKNFEFQNLKTHARLQFSNMPIYIL